MNSEKLDRKINMSRILRTIWLNLGISRIQIANELGLDKSTITNIVSALLKNGIIKTIAEGKASPLGGRKPILLTINKNFACILGIEMRPDGYRAVVVNLEGELIYTENNSVAISGESFNSHFYNIYQKIKNQIDQKKLKLIGIGIGIGGIVNPVEGSIYQSIPLNIFQKTNITEQLSRAVDIPVFIENDANCCCWGELAFNKMKRLQNFIFVLGEFREKNFGASTFQKGCVGIGIGIVINGKVYYGNDFSAGEFRSIFWKKANIGQFSLSENEISLAIKKHSIFMKFIQELAANLALMVNTFNLSHVFLGGFIDKYKAETITLLMDSIQKNWVYPNKVNCQVQFSSFNNDVVAYGAAAMLLEYLFSLPEISVNNDKDRSNKEKLIASLT